MMKLNDLKGQLIRRKGKTYIDLVSAKSIDKYTDRILQVASDFCTIDKVKELTIVTNIFTYANDRTEKENYYFIRVNGCLRLVSKQAFNVVDSEFMKNKTIVKGAPIPSNSTLGQEYIDMFYITPEAY